MTQSRLVFQHVRRDRDLDEVSSGSGGRPATRKVAFTIGKPASVKLDRKTGDSWREGNAIFKMSCTTSLRNRQSDYSPDIMTGNKTWGFRLPRTEGGHNWQAWLRSRNDAIDYPAQPNCMECMCESRFCGSWAAPRATARFF